RSAPRPSAPAGWGPTRSGPRRSRWTRRGGAPRLGPPRSSWAGDLAGVEVPAGVVVGQQPLDHALAHLADVLGDPRLVLGAHRVVVRDGGAEVHERLLHRVLRRVVLLESLLVRGVGESEGEVEAGPGVVAVRHVAEHEAGQILLRLDGVEGVVDLRVDLVDLRPGRPGVAHVAEH